MAKRNGRTKFVKPLADLAKLLGTSPETLRAHLKRDKPCPTPPKTESALGNWVTKYHGWKREEIGTFQQEQQAAARASRDEEREGHDRSWAQWRAEKLRLEVAKTTGELVERKQVVELAGKAVLTVRARLNALVTKMAARLENVPAHVVTEELQDEVDGICGAFAQGMSKTFGEIDDDAPCPFCSEADGAS